MTQTWQHMEESVELAAPVDSAFAYLDDHKRLGAHMNRSSWMMAGSRMQHELDEAKVLVRKSWETRGVPKLLVIGPYRMGFDLTPRGASSSLRVFIDYLLPEKGVQRLLGLLFGRFHARWCVRSMATDAEKHLRHAAA